MHYFSRLWVFMYLGAILWHKDAHNTQKYPQYDTRYDI